ncbi:DNA cytosine methyltransferase [Rhizobium sp. SU303]|uniref:DNA cytosine methyltransferase n=1 Tax=Rhizobium sp. SU303 TaxID=3138065 RepID=UPI001E6158DC|nr:DNA cytosine methyltransferase [Rhizobium leguminosarum]UFW79850.1 DNA cytosine methyltransferase [Rhizobium leguminosarum bv. viciae]
MTEKTFPDEQKLVDDADTLKRTMDKLSKLLVKAAKVVKRIQTEASPDVAEALLMVQVGVTPEDARLFRSVGELVEKDADLLENAVSAETLRVLFAASDADRAEAIRAIKAGLPVGEAKMKHLESHRRWIEKGAAQAALDARSASLESLATRNVHALLRNLESRADELRDAAAQFANHFGPGDPQQGFEMEMHRAGYFEAHADVTAKASAVLNLFELILGKGDAPEAFGPKDSEASALEQSHRALERLSSGSFGHQGGFAFDIAAADIFSWEIIDALNYICTQSPPEAEPSRRLSRPPRKLRVLELGAGAGGQAIGLMSAGFEHVALYERIRKRANTLKANWPTWPVRCADLRNVPDAELARHHGVDLLAGGISSNMVSRQSGQDKRSGDDDLVPELLRAVRVVQPRAFMIESARGFAFESHVAYLAEFKAGLSDLGYTVESYLLDMKLYGLPRDDERIVLVGIRLGEPGTFLPPTLQKPIDRYVQDALGDLVILHETPANLKHTIPRKTPQWHYDQWAALWRSYTRTARLSTISREWKESRPERQKDSEAKVSDPFDRSGFAATPPRVEDFLNENDDYRPKMTREIAARAQGFPKGWMFRAKGGGNIDMIADAMPPILAKAVALQIYSALTGITFDLDAALAKPNVNERQIGVGDLRLNAGTQSAHTLTQIETLLRGDADIASEPTMKKRQARLRSLLKEVEPNHMRRTTLVKTLQRIQWERERQATEDHAALDRLFPNGIPEGVFDWLEPERNLADIDPGAQCDRIFGDLPEFVRVYAGDLLAIGVDGAASVTLAQA